MGIQATYVLPHAPILIGAIGNNQTEPLKATVASMRKVAEEIKAWAPDAIVVVSPHGPVFNDAIALYQLEAYKGDFGLFGKPDLAYDFKKSDGLMRAILEMNDALEGQYYPLVEAEFKLFNYEPTLDHGVLVPMHFLKEAGVDAPIVCMSYGTLGYETLLRHGQMIKRASDAAGLSVVVIASGDLSHALSDCGPCDYHEHGEVFDHHFVEMLNHQKPYDILLCDDTVIENAKECGLRSYAMGLGALMDTSVEATVYSYEGPYGVGYLCARLIGTENDDRAGFNAFMTKRQQQQQKHMEREHFYAKLARGIVTYYVENGAKPSYTVGDAEVTLGGNVYRLPYDVFPSDLETPKGCFVSIKKEGALRGCIGTVEADDRPLMAALIENAIDACSSDSRFEPVAREELMALKFSVDLLSPLEPIACSTTALDPDVYGIVVTCDTRSGVLLPRLEGVRTAEEQLNIACSKGGFAPDHIEALYRFTVARYT